MKLAKFVKSPAERKRYTIDYSEWLDTGETISSVVFAVTPTDASTLTVDSYQIATPATSLAFYVGLGLDGGAYTVNVKITSSGGQVKEDQIGFMVKSA